MADTLEPKHIDKRTNARYLQSGVLDEKAFERHLKALPDLTDKALIVETVMDDEEDFDDEIPDVSGEQA